MTSNWDSTLDLADLSRGDSAGGSPTAGSALTFVPLQGWHPAGCMVCGMLTRAPGGALIGNIPNTCR